MARRKAVATIEHEWTWEQRQRVERGPIAPATFTQHRVVCSCGFATRWERVARRAYNAGIRHAHHSQQSWRL